MARLARLESISVDLRFPHQLYWLALLDLLALLARVPVRDLLLLVTVLAAFDMLTADI